MKIEDDPSPIIYLRKKTILQITIVLFTFIASISILVNLENPSNVRSSLKTIRTNDIVEVNNTPNVLGFIKEDLEQTKLERVRILQIQKRAVWSQTSPAAYEAAIIDQCNAVGCDPNQVIRVMMCESSGNPYAVNTSNNTFYGLFQHHINYWPIRANRYGVPGASIYDPYAQIHVTTRMFSEGLGYLWECK